MADDSATTNRRHKVQSVEVGMGLLIALSRLGATVPLSQLAKATKMAPSKAHRYMKALVNTGLAAQEQATGLYRLGPEALSIGFTSIGYLDVVSVSGGQLAALRDQVDETCFLSVWANKGPAVVRIEPATRAVVINVRIGSFLPLLTSATGQIFAAFLDNQHTRDMLDAERKELRQRGRQDLIEQGEKGIAEASRRRVASVTSTLTPGVSAVAAPIFDYQQKIAGVYTAMGPTAYFDESLDGRIAHELLAAASTTEDLLGRPKV